MKNFDHLYTKIFPSDELQIEEVISIIDNSVNSVKKLNKSTIPTGRANSNMIENFSNL